MAENDGRLNFSAYIDNSELKSSADESKRILSSLGDIAEASGGRMDNSLRSALSGVKAMAKEAADVFALIGKDFDISTTEAKMSALETVISQNEEVAKELAMKFDELGASAREAFAEGNFGEFDNLTSQMEQTATSLSEVTAETDKYRTILESMKAAQGDVSAAADETNRKEEESASLLVTLLGGQEKYNTIIEQLPPSLKSACQGLEGMTGAAKAFIATPLGAVLAGIILALKALSTWFNSTVEGQMAFAKVSGYVSGVLGQLKEIVIAVGKAIYKAFTDPREAVVKLWNVIKENIVNRFKALGDIASSLGQIMKSAFTFDWDGVTKGVREMGEGFLLLGTGIEDVTGKIGGWASGVNEAAKATSEIAVANRELEIEVSEWQKKREQLEQVKAEARMKMYDTSLSREDREKALNAYKDALDRQVAKETEFAERRIALQERTMSLTSNTIEDENKLRDLEAEKLRIVTQAKQELAMLQRRSNSITNTAGQEQKSEDALLKLQNANTQAEIDAMAEGSEKKIAQIRFNYEREIAEVKAQEEKWRSEQAGELTAEQQTAITEAVRNAGRRRDSDTLLVNQEDLEAALANIETYEQRRTAIQKEYAERRKSLYVDGEETRGLKAGVTEGNVAELNRSEHDALNAIDEEFASREETFQAWCEQIADMSLVQLENVLAKAQEELAALEKAGETDSQKLSTARAKVTKAQQAVSKANARQDIGVSKRSIKEWEDLYSTLNECSSSFDEMGDTIGGTAGEILKSVGKISASTLNMINGIVTLVQSSGTAMTTTATAGATAISIMEKASVILAVISAALQVAMTIANLFNSDDEKQEMQDALQSRIDHLQWMLDNADIVRLQEEYGTALGHVKETYEEYQTTATAALKMVAQQYGFLGVVMESDRIAQEAMAASAGTLAAAYANVAYAADKAFGAEKFDNAKEQLENIAQQQLLINEWIEQERENKDVDSSAIEEYEQKIEELGKDAVDIINGMVEDIIGGSSTDIAEELGDAFFEAFQDGEDYAEAWGDKVNDIVADVIKRMLISQFLEAPLGEIFNKYKAKWYKDGNFVGIDAVIESMSGFAADLDAVGDEFAAIWESLPDSVRNTFTTTSEATREASAEGIATASQDSVDELNGRMTAVQGHTYSISENTRMLVANTDAILQSVVNIEVIAEALSYQMDLVETNVKTVKDTLNDIALYGIRLK